MAHVFYGLTSWEKLTIFRSRHNSSRRRTPLPSQDHLANRGITKTCYRVYWLVNISSPPPASRCRLRCRYYDPLSPPFTLASFLMNHHHLLLSATAALICSECSPKAGNPREHGAVDLFDRPRALGGLRLRSSQGGYTR